MSADIRLLRWPERDRDDYERLAAAIERVARVAARGRGEIVATVPTGPEEPDDVERAQALLDYRRYRDAAAGPLAELFGEPGWDILLTLFVALEEGRTMAPAAIVESIPIRPAVLMRWLKVLASRDLIWTSSHDGQAMPDVVSLTDAGVALALRCIGKA
ncbi:DNA-binding MarR family transcriptional regulator [Sphingomonas insulae]|uniref:MarR family transcriptional regulator n=1 Tax=Sphingomonas insulae TaxID=424800 RepID=A0ABN1I0I5_9SPHN|nr:hypothetical protein [Sphingomonas insulae]NIJ30539.1 DNA-binding MarR family transcriptional regulator [Sphingomonas insulae]